MDIEREVLARLKPTSEDEKCIGETVELLTKKVMAAKAAQGKDIEPYLVGSIAKGTHLKDPDADLFLLFDPKVPRDELEEVGLAIGKQAVTGREHYAEHPYIKGEFMGLRVDIVPAYRIIDSSQKMTAVDRTPFHTEYVKKHLEPQLRDDVRLLKAFMKGIGTYGADAKTMGFSGYLCELLVIRFGGFRALLESASGWRRGLRLELGKATDRKFDSPLTFIDPVDAARNVSSAVSEDCLAMFIAASRAYTAAQKLEFFFPNPVGTLPVAQIRKRVAEVGGITFVKMPRPDLIDDILYPQLRKFEKNACQHLDSAGFRVVESSSHAAEKSLFIIVLTESPELPEAALHRGPPVSVAENSASFLEKWRGNPDAVAGPFIRDGCWHVLVRRRHRKAAESLNHSLDNIDAGKDLNALKSRIRVADRMPDTADARRAASLHLDRRPPWERS
jgi:tRNA nucleotidyltransferase (CCA-adding enzyme)